MAPTASHFQTEITPIPDRLAPVPGFSSVAAWVMVGRQQLHAGTETKFERHQHPAKHVVGSV